VNFIVTELASGARCVVGPGQKSEGDITRQLESIAKSFPDLVDVINGKKWVPRPFDWGDYK
jgi:hypothetical protein